MSVWILLLGLLLPASAGAEQTSTVIVLSWDGTRHDYPERAPTPALDRMQREGARARLVPVFPSNTFPSHVSLATGAPVDVHGIVGNRFTDDERGSFSYDNDASWIRAEPIWAAAERQGVRAAAFFWVGSETDWNGVAATHRVTPFDASIGEDAKVERILDWLDLPAAQRPRLILSWWHGCDAAGHAFGPDDARVALQLQAQDAELGRLLDGLDSRGLWPRTTLIVLADHGMIEARRTIDVRGALARAQISGRVEAGGGMAYVHLEDANQAAAALASLAALDGVQAWSADATPERLRARHPGRTGHLTLLTTPPRTFSQLAPRGYFWKRLWTALFGSRPAGMHGYDPALPEMSGIFYVMGRQVPVGVDLGAVRAIDVAPTLALLLGIEPPAQAEGTPISPLRRIDPERGRRPSGSGPAAPHPPVEIRSGQLTGAGVGGTTPR